MGTELDTADLLRDTAVAGLVALLAWVALGAVGIATGVLAPVADGILRFPVAVLVAMAPYAAVTEVRERRLRRLSPDERFGFAVTQNGPPRD